MKKIKTIESTCVAATGVFALNSSLKIEEIYSKTILVLLSIAMIVFAVTMFKDNFKK